MIYDEEIAYPKAMYPSAHNLNELMLIHQRPVAPAEHHDRKTLWHDLHL